MDNTANEKLTATYGESCYRRESVYMKFKGIELIEGEESEAELFVNVEISTECDDAEALERGFYGKSR